MHRVLLRRRVLIVDDHAAVRAYASRAFHDFDRRLAEHPAGAQTTIIRLQSDSVLEKPIDLLSCDINMTDPQTGYYGPIGVEFMRWFHQQFPDIPVLCHSDDVGQASMVPFAHFVSKSGLDMDDYPISRARLRAMALDLLDPLGQYDSKNLIDLMILRAFRAGPRPNLDGVDHSSLPSLAIDLARESGDYSDVFAFYRAGYLSKETLMEVLRYLHGQTAPGRDAPKTGEMAADIRL